MKLFRHFALYTILVGISLPTASLAMNGARAAYGATKATAQAVGNAAYKAAIMAHGAVKGEMEDFANFWYENPEVIAIKQTRDIDSLENNVAFASLADKLKRELIGLNLRANTNYRGDNDLTGFKNIFQKKRALELLIPRLRSAETAAQGTPRHDAAVFAVQMAEIEQSKIEILIRLYMRLERLYGSDKLDTNGPNTVVNTGPFAKNTQIIIEMCQKMGIQAPFTDFIFFPTKQARQNHREHGVVTGFVYPITKRFAKKIVLIDMPQFNALTGSEKREHIARTLAQIEQQEKEWRIFKKENRIRGRSVAKTIPYILATCAIVYYTIHADQFTLATLTDWFWAGADAGKNALCGLNVESFCPDVSAHPVETAQPIFAQCYNTFGYMWGCKLPTPQTWPEYLVEGAKNSFDGFYNLVVWLLSSDHQPSNTITAAEIALAKRTDELQLTAWQLAYYKQVIYGFWSAIHSKSTAALNAIYSSPDALWSFIKSSPSIGYNYALGITPYWIKSLGAAFAGSKIIGAVGTKWNNMREWLDACRADKIQCQKRGVQGAQGVFERVGKDVHANNAGFSNACYLWAQKKLGRI